jgi:membrane associated rhomboid family serine protease
MAYSSRSYGFSFTLTSMVKRLMIANVVVFAVTSIGPQAFLFDWFAFQPQEIFFRPWGAITYMFLHGDLMHLAVNMLVLFFFGPPLEGKWGEREFLRFFIVCGLGGAALSYVFMFSSAPIQIVGASGAGYGIMLGFAMNWPDAPIYVWGIFPVKAKYLVGFFFVLSAMSAVQGTGGGVAHFAHLGGLLAGFGYLKSDWRPKQGLGNLKKAATRSRRLAIVPRDEERGEEPAVGTSARSHDENPALYDKVDVVLDKISAQGMSSLTSEELKLLDEVSKRHRTN